MGKSLAQDWGFWATGHPEGGKGGNHLENRDEKI